MTASREKNCSIINKTRGRRLLCVMYFLLSSISAVNAVADNCTAGTTYFYSFTHNNQEMAELAMFWPIQGGAETSWQCFGNQCRTTAYIYSCDTILQRYSEYYYYYYYPLVACPPDTTYSEIDGQCHINDPPPPPPPEAPKKTSLVYVNGMNNSSVQATLNMDSLYKAYRDTATNNGEADEFDYAISYNHKEDQLSQFFEVARQRLAEHGLRESQLSRMLYGQEPIHPSILDALVAYVIVADITANDHDLNVLVDTIRYKISNGARVLLVAHSQGNLYANRAYNQLTEAEKNSVGVLSIATPSSYVAGVGEWSTLTNDVIMKAVRTIFPDTLPGNVTNTTGYQVNEDILHHNLLKSYMDGDVAGPKIKQQMLESVKPLVRP